MALLSKAQILQAEDLPFEDVDVPEWGGTVRVRSMTGKERDAYEESCVVFRQKGRKTVTERNLSNARAKLLARCIIDETGNLLFGEPEIQALGMKSARALDRVYEVATQINGMSAEDMEELEGKSEAGQTASSPST